MSIDVSAEETGIVCVSRRRNFKENISTVPGILILLVQDKRKQTSHGKEIISSASTTVYSTQRVQASVSDTKHACSCAVYHEEPAVERLPLENLDAHF